MLGMVRRLVMDTRVLLWKMNEDVALGREYRHDHLALYLKSKSEAH